MIKPVIFFILILFSVQLHSQKLVYNSCGNIRDSLNNKISSNKVRELLADKNRLLLKYNEGREKKTIGNILIIGGFTFLATDLVIGASGPLGVKYPSTFTYVGLASLVLAIPIKIGFTKKIEDVVSDYNNQNGLGINESNFQKMEFISNSKGLGLRLTLN